MPAGLIGLSSLLAPSLGPYLNLQLIHSTQLQTSGKTTMTRSTTRNPVYLVLLASTLLLVLTHAQVGTITQDVYSLSAFSLQNPCAQSCFVATGFCPNDVLGGEIGCKSWDGCSDRGWQATNDCYCRPDLQKPAQDHLTTCVEKKCTVGDVRIDASRAGSIYAQYCAEKGYSPAAEPAVVQATTTGLGDLTTTVRGGVGGGPTASSTLDSQRSSSSESPGSSSGGSGNLSASTILGIVVGSLAGLAFLAVTLWIVLKCIRCMGGRKVPAPMHQLQPVYPTDLYPGPYNSQDTESEVTPGDSVSVVSWMPPRPAPTFVSNAHTYSPHGY
jgi:hypothetical protein